MIEASKNPKHIWDRVGDLAQRYGVKPISHETYPLIGAFDSQGNYYDVEEVLSAVRHELCG